MPGPAGDDQRQEAHERVPAPDQARGYDMKFGINLYLWADDMHDGLLPVLGRLKQIGFDGVEVPIFDLDQAKWSLWARRLDDLGLLRTANTVIAAEHNPLSPDPAVREAAYQHMRQAVDCCATVGSALLCGPHQAAPSGFTRRGATAEGCEP